uniref:Uncharacterized protein n=1 Tax=Anguilla anguilla TaxID=7936 RepID=A0A0E9R7Q2_ANGAN
MTMLSMTLSQNSKKFKQGDRHVKICALYKSKIYLRSELDADNIVRTYQQMYN